MEDAVRALIDRAKDPAKARITIAYFSFSNKAVLNKLCEKGRAGFRIEGFFDSSSNAPETASEKLRTLCQKQDDPNARNVRVHYLGKTDWPKVWRLHHNKFLIVDSGEENEPVSVNFSSGNLSASGLSIHMDHWVMVLAPRQSNLVTTHGCVVRALRASLVDPDGDGQDAAIDSPEKYRATLDQCLAQINALLLPTAMQRENIAPLFSPNPDNSIYQALKAQIRAVKSGGTIVGAIQHFNHGGIAADLRAAASRGVKVTLLMDDDIVIGGSEVPGVTQFYNNELKNYTDPITKITAPTGIQIRFMETNSENRQSLMHNKFLILDGKRVFSGAGHFTDAGMKKNYENFYFSQVPALTEQYKKLYEWLYTRSFSEADIKKKNGL